MGIEAVIFLLLSGIATVIILWRADVKDFKIKIDVLKAAERFLRDALADEQRRSDGLTVRNQELWDGLKERDTRCNELEAEIQRLRSIPLTQEKEKKDNSVIKAKSSAQVRQITESVFGKQPDLKEMN